MSLAAGSKLGPYEIVSPLGAGGMGEVYKARDSRLERDVAIKVLPQHLSSNPDLKQRLEREAKAISALQHANICRLYDIGSQAGTDFLVMEYLQGETLAERLSKGALPLQETLKIARDMAEALAKAHRQGIVHRDLKPGNIMLTADGAKLMDFGLAKPAVAVGMGAAAGPLTPSTPTMSVAALSSPASPLTQKGQVVGTFQYMAPEVLQGAEADARSDLFAFGCVLYEMATGKRAFEAKSQLGVMTAILEKDPEPAGTAQPSCPALLQQVIHTCLEKDPARRFEAAHDVALQLAWVSDQRRPAAASTSTSVSFRAGVIASAALLAVITLASFLLIRAWPRPLTLQASIATPDGMTTELVGDYGAPPTLSPDGTMLVLRASSKNNASAALWIRHLDNGVWQRLDGTENANFPFWSQDSRNLGFFTTDGKLCRISVSGGTVTQIAAAPVGRGGSWSQDGAIIFSPNFQTGLYRVSSDGGTPVEATRLNRSLHTTHRWPQMLPDGKHFLYLAANHSGGELEQNGIYFASLDGKVDRRVLSTDANAIFAGGYLLYHAGTALQARRFDPEKGEFTGEPVTISDNVQFDSSTWHLSVTASDNGELIFASGGPEETAQLAWFDRNGKSEAASNIPPGQYIDVRLSPDGRRIAVSNLSTVSDIWVIDLQRGTPTRITFGGANHFTPVWSPDGRRIAYAMSNSAGSSTTQAFGASVYVRNADGSGQEERVLQGDTTHSINLSDWTPDGKYLLYTQASGPSFGELMALPLFGDRKPFVVLTPPTKASAISDARVSKDGRWLAYSSNESGRDEVYITSFPKATSKVAVSSDGGIFPAWREDGRELYYQNVVSTRMFAVDVKPSGEQIQAGVPRTLFDTARSSRHWDVTADGKRFIATTLPEIASRPLTLITHWTSLVKKK